MESSGDVFDLCRDAFGRVESRWLAELHDLVAHYSADQLAEAFGKAKAAGARQLGYVRTVLKDVTPQQAGLPGAPPLVRRLPCDGCGIPHWLDSLAVVAGRALCAPCATALGHDEDAGVSYQPIPMTPEELQAYPTGTLIWWHGQPSCSSAERFLVEAELERRGVAVEAAPATRVMWKVGPPAPTAAARKVTEYRKGVMA